MMSRRPNNYTSGLNSTTFTAKKSGLRNGTDWNSRKSRPDPKPPDGTSFPKVLTALESTYMQVRKTDKLLHQQLGEWFEHMEEWMHYQKHMFIQMHDRCLQLGLHEEDGGDTYENGGSPMRNGGPARVSHGGPSVSFPTEENKQFAPKMPRAASMKSYAVQDYTPVSPVLPQKSSQPLFQALEAKEKTGDSPQREGSHTSQGSPGAAVLCAPSIQPVGGDSAEGIELDHTDSVFLNESTGGSSENVTSSMMLEALPYIQEERVPLQEETIVELDEVTTAWEEPEPAAPESGAFGHRNLSFAARDSVLSSRASTFGPTGTASTSQRSSMVQRFSTSMMIHTASGKRRAIQTAQPIDWETADFADKEWEQLPNEMRMWCELVDAVLYVAEKKKFYELRETWKQSEIFMQRIIRNNDNLDLRVLAQPRGTAGKGTSVHARASVAGNQHLHVADVVIDAAANVGEKFNHARRCRSGCVMDPQSPQRLTWMSIGMVLMVYDLIILPMQAFEIEDNDFLTGVQWFGQIFWTCDILVTFLTGVYVNSELKTDMRTITRVYATSWLPFDLAVVLPLWIVEIMGGGDGGGAENASALKLVRMMRFLRLARMAKFEHYLQEALASVNSSYLILLVGILKLMTAMIILSHLNACIWYAVGNSVNGGWASEYEGTDTFYKYLTAMHWAFTQFQGTSEITPGVGGQRIVGERAYAVVVVMCSLIILASFVSTLTNMMMQLQALREEKVGMARRVRAYLSDNEISKQLSVRVKKYMDWKQRMQRKDGNSSEILDMLPSALQLDLQEEVRGPMVNVHKFFAAVQTTHVRVFRQICHEVLRPMSPAPGEMIFNQQDECAQMFFVVSGTPKYIHTPARMAQAVRHQSASKKSLYAYQEHFMDQHAPPAQVPVETEETLDNVITMTPGDYCCEPILWTIWEFCGRLAGTEEASSFIVMPATEFASVVSGHPPMHVSAIFYARRFVAGLNRFGKSYHDIIDISMMAEEEMDEDGT